MTNQNAAGAVRKILLRRKVKIALLASGAVAVGLLLFVAGVNWRVSSYSTQVYSDADALPAREYGLLLGTSRIIDGKWLNQYFQYRIDAAVKLYRMGKIKKIIVSGDNRRRGYNEPEDMRAALLEKGVNPEDILPDYAGFSTLDSVIRARNCYGRNSFVVISQRFHCERALYIASHHDIDAVGFEAGEVSPRFRVKRYFREPLARVKAFCDLNLFHTRPHFER